MRPVQTTCVLIAALCLSAFVLPLFVSEYVTRLIVMATISAIAVIGLNIVFGYTGLISLGDVAFAGLSAYTVAILTTRYGFNLWVAMSIAIAVTALSSYIVGRVVLRLKGHYLALATLGLNVSFTIVASNWTALTGGNDGIANIPVLSVFGFVVQSEREFYWFALAVLIVAALVAQKIRNSHAGRTFIAIRDDELAASMTGISVPRAKTAAFTIGSVYFAVAGCLFALHAHFISPEDFAYHHSITHLAMLILGGEGTLAGAIFGAATVTMLPELLRGVGNAYLLIFGFLILLVLIVMPKGVVGLVGKLRQKQQVAPVSAPSAMEVSQ